MRTANWHKSSYSNQDGGACIEVSNDFIRAADWHKSSHSNPDGGACLEVSDTFVRAADWRKSSHSNPDGGECLEVSDDFAPVVPVRDSKVPDGPVLVFGAGGWVSFVAAVKEGELGAR
ncbi:DUF397 domain-containing protein [Streptomyces albus]|uniref:DUF397 domain-containing protein n=1 Tax=Streptomyces sp. NRRL F-5639 TaxID=1463867 RepID=UPI002D21AC9C|nr:DUF397 domain-containing protein [Streptomyces sp. NRRL F-5639]